MTNHYNLRTRNKSFDKTIPTTTITTPSLITSPANNKKSNHSLSLRKKSCSNKENDHVKKKTHIVKFARKLKVCATNKCKSPPSSPPLAPSALKPIDPLTLLNTITSSSYKFDAIPSRLASYERSRVEFIKLELQLSLERFKNEYDPFNLAPLLRGVNFLAPPKNTKRVISWHAFKHRQQLRQDLPQIDLDSLNVILGSPPLDLKRTEHQQYLHLPRYNPFYYQKSDYVPVRQEERPLACDDDAERFRSRGNFINKSNLTYIKPLSAW